MFAASLVKAADNPLEGSWLSSCKLIDSSVSSDSYDLMYDIIKLTFKGNTFHSDIKIFTDAGCNLAHPQVPNPTANGQFTTGKTFENSSKQQVTEIDTLITQFNGADFEISKFQVFLIQANKLYLSPDDNEK